MRQLTLLPTAFLLAACSARPAATDAAGAPAAPAAAARQVIRPAGARPSAAPLLSPAILVGNTLYLSGSLGTDPATGQLAAGGVDAEVRQIIANVRPILQAAGMDLSNVVSVTAYLVDAADYQRFNTAYREFFTGQTVPTRTTVIVKELVRGARVELTMTAAR